MLDMSDFKSWQQRIRLYCLGKENKENILQSIDEGLFKMGKFRETLADGALGPERDRVVKDLTPEERKGSELTRDERESQLYNDFEHFCQNKGETIHEYYGRQNRVPRNNARGAVAARNGRVQNRVGNANPGGQDSTFHDDVDEPPVQDLALNVDQFFQVDQCDAFDSNIDEAPTTQTMFMANLSSANPIYDEAGPSYDSNILSEVQDHDNYLDCVGEYHEVHEMQNDVQQNNIVDSNAEYTSDSNIIMYEQYVKNNA
ncbi:hypothetical protein Tco_0255287 [Tanacetum coccineum]